ncbi:unnamed protein product [Microthlaspi erraticum]|uniref:Zinc finger PHD-type domain-containing protein n=1 Tax=Microthlaspi erraticum TaxID=1685480 RepID=A0A6D2JYF8_9BRAS|nr:unnamed protein product [Microthlaspi erraticum]
MAELLHQHFSHECALKSPKIVTDDICSICFEDVPVEFTCSRCNFDLCKACFELPQKVSHDFHPEHPLEFCLGQYDRKPGHVICSGCGNMCSRSFYECKKCEIYLDLGCALMENIFRGWDAKELLHYSHSHLLRRSRPGPDAKGSCLLCELPLSPSAICYGCVHCYLFVHEHCFGLTMEIHHPVHPKHLLMRLDYIQLCGGDKTCDACGLSFVGVPFGCLSCNFYIHLRCADSLLRGLVHKSHDHMLFYVATNAETALKKRGCGICKRKRVVSLDCYYQCVQCDWKCHFKCLEIPESVVNTGFHIHPLVCKTFLAEDDSLEHCGVCETVVNEGHYAYSCNECDFLGHIECILRKDEPSPLYLKDLFSPSKDIKRRTDEIEDKIVVNDIGEIHELRLKMRDMTERCDSVYCKICAREIYGNPWKCEDCNFVAHYYCAELGRPSRQRIHLDHVLTLLPHRPAGVIINCNTCKNEISGFNLFCRICSFTICIRCLVRSKEFLGVLYRGQKVIGITEEQCMTEYHDLVEVIVSRSYPMVCALCEDSVCGESLSCMDCGEIYHHPCVELSREEAYQLHPGHDLEIKQISGFKCLACKLNIIKYGIYCPTCKVGFHYRCIKAGTVSENTMAHSHILYNFWSNDLRLTRACSVCDKLCGASFYGCLGCNFFAHVECIGFPPIARSQQYQHIVVETYTDRRCRCSLCGSYCSRDMYYCLHSDEDYFHQECIITMDDRKEATEEEQLGEIYLMYLEIELAKLLSEDSDNDYS